MIIGAQTRDQKNERVSAKASFVKCSRTAVKLRNNLNSFFLKSPVEFRIAKMTRSVKIKKELYQKHVKLLQILIDNTADSIADINVQQALTGYLFFK